MGGIVGRLFREFAITLSIAILVSLAGSLTTTPMMCARLLRPKSERRTGRIGAWSDRVFAVLVDGYISPEDLDYFTITDSPTEVVERINEFYRGREDDLSSPA